MRTALIVMVRRAVLLSVAAIAAFAVAPAASHAAPCTPPVVNEVACENTKAGADPDTWQIEYAGDPSIQGFATSMTVNRGSTVSFKIKSSTPSYTIDILRLGYYGGDGARLIQGGLTPTGPSTQPPCNTDASTGLIDCANWSVSRSWTVPADAVSGVYIAHLKRNDGQGDSHIVFVVRNDASHSDIVVQTSDTTWQAYNQYGGNSTYVCTVACPPGDPRGYKGAYKVSYNRPLTTEFDSAPSALFGGAEYSMIRFLEANGYDVSYISGADTHRRGALLLNHDMFLSSGHDEYWSGAQRSNVEAARAAGVNLGFFSGNEMFWKHRWEPGADGTQDRILVTYKDTHFDSVSDQDPVEWTGTWRDPRFLKDGENRIPENALTGQSFLVNAGTSAITVPYAYRQLRMWRNTAVASLSPGGTRTLAPGTLGYEWDEDADNGFRPAGQFRLSSTTVSGLEVFTDYGSSVKTGGTATHNLVMHRAASGALVFGAGTVQWAWGLSDWNPAENPADTTMQQATVNLLADMGAQPSTLTAGLAGAAKTTDVTKPTATLSAPPGIVQDGAQVTLSGTASDSGGVVAGVEVSTDNGVTWHPATGTTSWTYSWLAHGHPSTVVKVRAVDDSGNLGNATAGTSVNVSCPCSIWGNPVTPAEPDGGDPSPVEVGVKFRSDTFGSITGVRFYKAAANTGTHTGSLWTADGQRLATATFTGETATGWQTATFDQPVNVMPNTTYVASYFAPNGHYSVTPAYFFRAPSPGPNGGAIIDSGPLHAVRNAGGVGNGVYGYGASSVFPVNSYDASNYWVDVRFTQLPAPGTVTGVTAIEGGRTSANVTWTAPASGGPVTSYRITPYIGATAQTPKIVSGSPPATTATVTGLTTGTTYTFRVEALNPNGAGPASAPSGPVTPSQPVAPAPATAVAAEAASQSARVTWTAPSADGDSPITGYTITPYIGATAQTPTQVGPSVTSSTVTGLLNGTSHTFRVTATNAVGNSPASAPSNAVTPQATIFDFGTPTLADVPESSPVELGVKFRADHDGKVTGIRFYKAAANTGTHVGSLWNSAGTRIGQVTFTGESASGWQTAAFAAPVDITAGQTYVASYFAPNGHYSITSQGVATGRDNGPLHALSNATTPNGVYRYGTESGFPQNSYNGTNYWVDVMYAIPNAGQVTGATASEGGPTSAHVSWTPPATGGPVSGYRVTPYVGTTPQTPKDVTGSPLPTTTKVSGLTTGTTYTFRVQAVNANGSGPASAPSNPVQPSAPVAPSAPSGVAGIPATRQARLTWNAPATDGDSPITAQTITPYIGAAAQTPVQVGAAATSATVTGLTNGVDYTFRVSATNAYGTSPQSTPSAAVRPQATIYDFAVPSVVDAQDGSPVELGVKFRSSFAGKVTGIRFYKAAANTGTHTGSLWSAAGDRLAQVTFANESASGWQTALFSTPVDIVPGTTYVASYFAPNGRYSVTGQGLAAAIDNPPLTALANSTSANGVYRYASESAFPTGSYNASSYSVDVLFDSAPAPAQVTGVSATAGERAATVSWSAPAGSQPVETYVVTPYIGSQAQAAKTVTGSPPATSTTVTGLTAGTAYTFKVRATNQSGPGPDSASSNAVTPLAALVPAAPGGVAAQGDSKAAIVRWTEPNANGSPIIGYRITPSAGSEALAPVDVDASATSARITGLANGTAYTFTVRATNTVGTGPASSPSTAVTPRASIFEQATPGTVDAGDASSVVLGVKFRSSVAGTVTGIRFYKAAANTGTHVGTLWNAAGDVQAQATFSNESASGWQAVTFATPVAIAADTTFVAGYLAPNGHYASTGAAFAFDDVANAPLRALANITTPNGLYAYSGATVFPTGSWNAANYWVDVLFAPEA